MKRLLSKLLTPLRPGLRYRAANDLLRRNPIVTHLVLVLAVGIALWQADEAAHKADTNQQETLGTIIAVQVENCHNDRQFRQQYKIRGEAEQALLALFVGLAQQNISELPEDSEERKTSEKFIEDFSPLLKKIKIIPIPNCKDTKRHLREAIGTGIRIPALSD